MAKEARNLQLTLARRRLLAVVLTVVGSAAFAQYPEISTVGSGNVVYRQHQAGVQQYYKSSRAGRPLPDLEIYSYEPKAGDTLITVASRLMVPYSALASLNRISGSEIPDDTKRLLVPNLPGIFVPERPRSELEQLVWDLRQDELKEALPISIRFADRVERFRFFPGADFDRVERLAFLRLLFRRPVRNTVISSHYGFRKSPVTGDPQFHAGVDFAAPSGVGVIAAREGRVSQIGVDPLFGKYVLLEHDGGYETFYGHLREVSVRLNDRVSSGMIIGSVGNSGRSTGPHLHFEIRQHGKHRDPLHHLPGLTR
jgi:murein DD-endopeptidase MepM/ murein hydrolase activator NlpD